MGEIGRNFSLISQELCMIVSAFGFVIAALWIVLAVRSLTWAVRSRFLKADLSEEPWSGQANPPRVAVIVPARNEEATIAATVAGLASQTYPGLTVTVVDDRSTDRTKEILDELAARMPDLVRVVDGVERPERWVGKTWAMQQGASHASVDAEWLAFVDADVALHPSAIAQARRQVDQVGADMISLVPRYRCRTFWQGSVAVMLGHLLWQLYPLGKVNRPQSRIGFAHGNFVMVRRSTYEQVGGYESVRGEIVEDIQFAQRLKNQGAKLSVHAAPDLIETHAYGDWRAIWRGLRKNAYAGMDYQMRKFLTGAIGGLILIWTPSLILTAGIVWDIPTWIGAGALGWLAQALASTPILAAFRLPMGYAFAMPLGLLAYIAIAATSVWDHHQGRVVWNDAVFEVAGPADEASA